MTKFWLAAPAAPAPTAGGVLTQTKSDTTVSTKRRRQFRHSPFGTTTIKKSTTTTTA
jgi:hypothetical protein